MNETKLKVSRDQGRSVAGSGAIGNSDIVTEVWPQNDNIGLKRASF